MAMAIAPLCSWLFDMVWRLAMGIFIIIVAISLRIINLPGCGDGDLTRAERALVHNMATWWEDDRFSQDRY